MTVICSVTASIIAAAWIAAVVSAAGNPPAGYFTRYDCAQDSTCNLNTCRETTKPTGQCLASSLFPQANAEIVSCEGGNLVINTYGDEACTMSTGTFSQPTDSCFMLNDGNYVDNLCPSADSSSGSATPPPSPTTPAPAVPEGYFSRSDCGTDSTCTSGCRTKFRRQNECLTSSLFPQAGAEIVNCSDDSLVVYTFGDSGCTVGTGTFYQGLDQCFALEDGTYVENYCPASSSSSSSGPTPGPTASPPPVLPGRFVRGLCSSLTNCSLGLCQEATFEQGRCITSQSFFAGYASVKATCVGGNLFIQQYSGSACNTLLNAANETVGQCFPSTLATGFRVNYCPPSP